MSTENFFTQDNDLHNAPDQQKRQQNALKLNVQSIDHDSKTGEINSYNVTLNTCTCRDYLTRRLPCKHIYRLAHELGIYQLSGNVVHDPTIKNYYEAKKVSKALLKVVVCLPDDEQNMLYEIMYNYLYKNKQATRIDRTLALKNLIDNDLISYAEVNLGSLVNVFSKDELIAIVMANNLPIKTSHKKLAILTTLINEYPDILNQSLSTSSKVFVIPSQSVLAYPKKIYGLVIPDDSGFDW